MKKINLCLLALIVATLCSFSTIKTAAADDLYYQFYVDESGNPTIFAGADSEFILAGCKFGDILCGQIYTIDDVQETFTGSGIYEVITGHEGNTIATYYRMD
jgi:hypothetical protein